MRGLISLFARHATLANIVLLVMLVAGLWAAPRMRAQYFPDSVAGELDVSVTWEGAGADDVDRAIVQVIEPALLAVEGVSASATRASEGRAQITLEFEPDWDMARAVSDAEAALATAGDLPEEAETPEITRSVWRETVTDIALSGPISPDQLGRLADELVARLYQVGVTRTSIQGMSAPQIVVEIPTEKMMAHSVTMQQIAALIAEAGLKVREAIREKGTPYEELGLDSPSKSDDELLDAMIARHANKYALRWRPELLMRVRLVDPSLN